MRRLLPATLLVSAAAIAYEILLMRMLSIVQWHHFAYMIISLALLGYGASGTFIAVFRQRLLPRFETAFAVSALAFSVSMVACYALGQQVPFNALEIVWEPSQFLVLSLMYLIFLLPFFFAACCIGLAFTSRSELVGRIYLFDLLGAGAGAVAVIALLFVLTPGYTLLGLALLPLFASLLVGMDSAAGKPLLVLQAAWAAVLALGLPPGVHELRVSEYKGLPQALEVVDSRVLSVRSGPLGHLTVVASPTVPFRHAPGLSFNSGHVPPEQLAVFTDADSMTAINRFDGEFDAIRFLDDTTAALAYRLLDSPSVLILGAGGGSDVLLALLNDAAGVDAVELDPQMLRLLTEDYADFAGHPFGRPGVTTHVGEARGYVARNRSRYDLIQIGLLDSFGASGAGVQALNESYIYTVEALEEYLSALAPGGVLSITRWIKVPPRDSLKLLATAIAALRQSGVADPGERIALIRSWNTSTLIVRNGAISSADADAIRGFARSHSFDLAWLPGMEPGEANRYNLLERPYLYEGARALLGPHAGDYLRRYKFHIAPATDDRPYFFHFFEWGSLGEILALRASGGAGLVEWGYLVLVGTLLQAVVIGLVLILLPLAAVDRSWPAGTGPRYGSYFLLLGLAFLFVEMAFIQKFILFLSHPLYSVAVVLSGFLVFAGIGSGISGGFARRLEKAGRPPLAVAVAGIAVLAIAYLWLLPVVFDRLVGLADPAKIAISLALIAPLAVLMGMPFPLGMARLSSEAPDFIPWAWGINGYASVVSAVLATLLAIELGFAAVVALALFLYAGAALLFKKRGAGRPLDDNCQPASAPRPPP